ncbi:MAG: phosphatidylglycerophosphatase A [Saprospiraceae bacterium]|nr:phosphatidylglycerophosphatase A [Saprospiraceae bacterium]
MWFHKTVVTVFGLGYAPVAPGTFGALGAVFLLGLSKWFDFVISTPLLLTLIIICGLVGIWSTDKLTAEWGDDPSKVVIDEFVGYLIGILFLPVTWVNILLCFVLFRFFDILKPLGVRTIDKKVKGGLGVMLDDVLAGVYTCISLHLINFFLSQGI